MHFYVILWHMQECTHTMRTCVICMVFVHYVGDVHVWCVHTHMGAHGYFCSVYMYVCGARMYDCTS